MLYQSDGRQKLIVEFRSLHRADLEHSTRLLDDPLDELALVDRQRQRLLAIDVFAREHRLDGDLGVPVIRGGDHHRIDVLAVKDLAVILVSIRFVTLGLLNLADIILKDLGVDVGQCREIRELKRLARDGPTLIAQSDRRKNRPVVG